MIIHQFQTIFVGCYGMRIVNILCKVAYSLYFIVNNILPTACAAITGKVAIHKNASKVA